ncbi:acetoacetate--CoA ligase [Ramlibacter humi]|uniref:Acetoacetate--CoA ligase n=1 Tax=Ramlibacter humi TaxID=2530451 RepID=A0A4Z0CDI4_9BURK|nr:acetoacetate--CoA ligase [Ramlibacter humi]
MAAFTGFVEKATGLRFDDYEALHAFSVREFRQFWSLFLQWCRAPLAVAGDAEPVCVGDEVEQARFFPLLQVSYADSLLNLSIAPAEAPAVTECHGDGTVSRLTRGELRDRVARLAAHLAAAGIVEGDRVVAVLRNDASAIAVALAVTAMGATLSTAAPDMGVQALKDRFAPLKPKLLIAHFAPQPFDDLPPAERVAQLLPHLPGLVGVLSVDGAGAPPLPAGLPLFNAPEWLSREPEIEFAWPRFHFNHPLFAMFSSGTTGKPKCIVHGAGGTLLEHVKEHRLHCDLRPGQRLYFHTSCGWMMWNWQLSALASGVEVVTYDGPIDSVDRLWQLVAREHVNAFGTSPGYLKMCEEAGFEPHTLDLSALHAVMSTGAVLHDRQFHWVTQNAKEVPVQSISGGTDIIGCFVLGHPDRAVRAGESQCRSLGLDVQAWHDGASAPEKTGMGQLVCATPFPSRPIGFHDDADGSRFHAAYFSQNPGVWTHGDLIELTPEGGARMHGRCDGVLNVRGTKFHPGEVYRVLAGIPGIVDAMLVQRQAAGLQQVVALLVLAPGRELDTELAARVRTGIRDALSSAHVPDLLLDVPALPVTHNGKPSESAARAAVDGREAANLAALRNPQCLDVIAKHPLLRTGEAAAAGEDSSLIDKLCASWATSLGLPSVGPDDNFFALGGNSLAAARVLRGVQAITGVELPLTALLQAPTVRELAALAESRSPPPSPLVAPMRAGIGRPLFLVHGLSGTVMECWPLVQGLRTERPVWGVQAVGLDGRHAPLRSVTEMATTYLAEIRRVQPSGPYALSGFSFGGLVAFEIARQLEQMQERVDAVVLLDPYLQRDLPWWREHGERAWLALNRLARMSPPARRDYLLALWSRWRHRQPAPLPIVVDEPAPDVRDGLTQALSEYRAPHYPGTVAFVHATQLLPGYVDPMPGWRAAVKELQVFELETGHLDLVGSHAMAVARILDRVLQSV